ncbi:hypothetical protein B795N_14770 [Marinilactibacillus psychrotolerans]|uniref:hypothetical protein n=1 Tax=Marinilactibacillus psychrotolerans TaxID=191770 RepID=UPI001C7D4966|nr:hypothetical protein [Marinilactibacillus psychrotolerans]GEQ33595.1 hypothetical protein B795N_14770 [Marinilactibacillus psychrotolerans]
MKKTIALISLTIVLLFSIISNIGLYQDNKAKEDNIQTLESKLQEQSEYVEVQDNVNHSTTEVVDKVQFVNEAFEGYLNYTSDTYQTRFNDMKDHFSAETIDKLQGAGTGSTPNISVESNINRPLTYASPNTENSFVYVTEIEYQVEDNEPTIFTNIYLVDLAEESGEFLITNVDVYSGNPTND